jgi:GNAT superfamily N-acetyltransferase
METWIDEAFELVEFAVLPAYHGKGIGGKLHDFALDGLPHRRAVLSTVQSETNALQLYRKRGWRILLDNFYFPSVAKPYLIMGLDLLEFKKRRESPPSST